MRKLVVPAIVFGVALVSVTVALAGGGYGGGYGDDNSTSTQSTSSTSTAGAETYSFKATLTAAAEVPKPTGVPATAGGGFTAKSTESGSKITFRWVLRFHGLSGKAMAAHVHLGKKGKAGPVVIPLCGPCKNGQSGTVKIKSSLEEALEKGGTYVNVHTAKNAAGEIRGQVKLVGK
jgi:hypothetical protein